MKIKKCLLFLSLLGVLALPAYASLSPSTIVDNQVIEPRQTAKALELNLSANSSVTNIQTQVQGFPFQTQIIESPTSLNDSQGKVTVNVTIPAFTTKGNYSGTLVVQSSEPTLNVPFTVQVPEQVNFTLGNLSYDDVIDSGFSGLFGNITIENNGNIDLNFVFNINGTARDLIDVRNNLIVLKGTTEQVTLSYDVPSTQKLSSYSGDLIIKRGNDNFTRNFTFTVVDVIPPNITSVNFEGKGFMATLTHNLNMEIVDNVDIADVSGELYYKNQFIVNETTGETKLENVSMGVYKFEKTEERDLWTLNFTDTDRIASYWFDLEVLDTSNNTHSRWTYFDLVPLDVIRHDEAVKLPQWKFDSFSKEYAFTLTNSSPVNLSLRNITYFPNATFTIGLERPDGTDIFFADQNDVLQIDRTGDWKLKIKGDRVGDLLGRLHFEPVKQHKTVKDLSFSVNFVSYQPPTDQTLEYDFGTVEQKVFDGDDPQNARVQYCVEVPLVNFAQVGGYIPVPQGTVDQCESNIDGLEADKANLGAQNYYIAGISLFTFLIMLGHLRWKTIVEPDLVMVIGDE